ncbi:MAG: transposase [Candidatus Chisholmbacteria bacterium]|nr:transposase [Candidatus Chisholmbacteria bacterium]
MPNHFHLLIRQSLSNGISKFMAKFQNSYTRYFNIRNKRRGALFLNQFKAVRIEDEEQLLHIVRYIHLNPYSAYLVKRIEELESYSWSSLKEYLSQQWSIVSEPGVIWSYYEGVSSFKRFIFDHADYQRQLETIKHLTLED